MLFALTAFDPQASGAAPGPPFIASDSTAQTQGAELHPQQGRSLQFRFSGPPFAGATAVTNRNVYNGSFGFEADNPGLFSVALPEGNYRVTLTLGDRRGRTETTVLAESRRLLLDRVKTSAGILSRSFLVHLKRPHLPKPPEKAPGLDAVRLKPDELTSLDWDDKLTFAFGGTRPAVASIKIESATVPAIYLLGDSTVTNQRTAPFASWGQMLPAFIGSGVVVANHAESGETLKSFLAAGRLDKVLGALRPGDHVLVQFGHNDQKQNWPQTYAAAASTYRAYLTAYLAEVRLRGATPILVTSPERANFDANGKVQVSLHDYAEAVRAVGAQQGVPVIDLNRESIRLYEALGPDHVMKLFGDPNDRTHHGPGGAYLLARFVAQSLREVDPLLNASVPPVNAGGSQVEVPTWDLLLDREQPR